MMSHPIEILTKAIGNKLPAVLVNEQEFVQAILP